MNSPPDPHAPSGATPPVVPGFRAAGVACGLKGEGALDLGLIVADEPTAATAVFTRTQLVGAHVTFCREQLMRSGGLVQALVVNSKNANCATGADGLADCALLARAAADRVGCDPDHVLVMSTGVIGARLPTDKILRGIDAATDRLAPDGLLQFAQAVMTTDTYPKVEAACAVGDSGADALAGADNPGAGGPADFTVAGVAKGSGMIHPDMATMLGFLLTDARSTLDHAMLLRAICDATFHAVTVDGDTSPNDTVLLWSTGRIWSRSREEQPTDPLLQAATDVATRLAKHIARDGEGATRLVTIRVTGAASETDARSVGRGIAISPLCKTAIYGRDPNWGRILSAASRQGTPIEIERARVAIGGHVMFAGGRPHPQNESAASQHLRDSDEVLIEVDLGFGAFAADAWTCDFSPEYVSINADYRT